MEQKDYSAYLNVQSTCFYKKLDNVDSRLDVMILWSFSDEITQLFHILFSQGCEGFGCCWGVDTSTTETTAKPHLLEGVESRWGAKRFWTSGYLTSQLRYHHSSNAFWVGVSFVNIVHRGILTVSTKYRYCGCGLCEYRWHKKGQGRVCETEFKLLDVKLKIRTPLHQLYL